MTALSAPRGYADLVRALVARGEDGLALAAELCGAVPLEHPRGEGDGLDDGESAEVGDSPPPEDQAARRSTAGGSTEPWAPVPLWRVSIAHTNPTADSKSALDALPELELEEDRHVRAPPGPALAPAAVVDPAVEERRRAGLRETELDVPRLVECLARGRLPARLPRQTRVAITGTTVVVVDRPLRLEPFWHDQYELLSRLRASAGFGAIEVRFLPWGLGSGREVKRIRAAGRDHEEHDDDLRALWDDLPPHAAVVALTDLGADGDADHRDAWRAAGLMLRARGAVPSAILLARPERCPADLARLWNAVPWETGRPAAFGGEAETAEDPLDLADRTERLLDLLATTPLPWPGLVRRLRHTFELGGIELDVAVWRRLSGGSPTPGERETRLRRLREGAADVEALDDEAKRTLVGLLREEHLPYAAGRPERWAQCVMYLLVALGDEPARFGLSEDEVNHQLGVVLALVRAAEHDRRGAVADGVRVVLRRVPPGVYQHPIASAVLKCAYKAVVIVDEDGEVSGDIPMPPGADPSLLPLVSERTLVLTQIGDRLRLAPLGLHDGAMVGVELARFRSRRPAVLCSPPGLSRSAAHAERWSQPLTPGSTVTLVSDLATVTLTAVTLPPVGQSPPPPRPAELGGPEGAELLVPYWATALWRERGDLFAGFDGGGETGWHANRCAVRWDPERAAWVAAGAWYTPPWAAEVGVDRFGVWARIELGASRVPARLRWIPPGTFLMGSPESDGEAWDDEKPQHEVTLTRGFWIADTPCTQAQWSAVMGENPSHFKGEARPVEQVSWDDVQRFCARANEGAPPLGLRLPSEAQWEYACRAGSPTPRYGLLEDVAWYEKNSGDETHPVGQKAPNGFGLYDTLGNVWEWCQDLWRDKHDPEDDVDPLHDPDGAGPGALRGDPRVGRGGSWILDARYARAASRGLVDPSLAWSNQGFRFSRGQGRGQGL